MRTNQGISFAGDVGWTQCARAPAEDREVVLVCVEAPLRPVLAEIARRFGYEPHVTPTPLQAIAALEDGSVRIRHAVISPRFDCGHGLHELIADEYPHVAPILMSA